MAEHSTRCLALPLTSSRAGDADIVLRKLLPALARVFAMAAQQLGASGDGQQELQRQLLALQLEALHVLLLLLPLPPTAQAPELVMGGDVAWPAQLRQGLALLLRGRISAVQRHSALRLAAAVVDLLGPTWLLGGVGGSTSGSAASKETQAFFQLLVEITKVETSVLLHDALAPDVPVPLASAAGAAAPEWRAPAPRRAPSDVGSSGEGSEAGDGLHEVGAELAADLAGTDAELSGGGVAADMEPLVRVLHSEEDRRQLEAQLQREQREAEAAAAGPGGQRQLQPGEHKKLVDAMQIPTGARVAGLRWTQHERHACRRIPLHACATARSPCACPPPPTPPPPHTHTHSRLQRWCGRGFQRRRARVLRTCCPPASPCWRPALRRWLRTHRYAAGEGSCSACACPGSPHLS